jgi:hypothetical protein
VRLDVRIKMQTIHNLFSCHVLAGFGDVGGREFCWASYNAPAGQG